MIHRRLVLVIAALALTATGCFRVDLKIALDDDGSGRIEGLTAIDADAAAEISRMFEGLDEEGIEAPTRDEVCDEFVTDNDVPEGATTEAYDEDGFCGVRFAQDFTPEEMDEALAEMSADGGDFVIRRDGDGWRFDATLDEEATGDTSLVPERLFEDAEFTIRVRLPGRQVEHNADRIEEDGTLVWDIDIANPPGSLMARTEPGDPIRGSDADGGGNTALIVILVVLAVVAIGGFLWWRSRSRSTPGTGPGGPPPVAQQPGAATAPPPGPPPMPTAPSPQAPAGPPATPPSQAPAGPPAAPPSQAQAPPAAPPPAASEPPAAPPPRPEPPPAV